MHDLRHQLGDTWRAASRVTIGAAHGRSVMFVSARSGEGVTSVAASFALLASEYVEKPVWLVDLDLRRNHAFRVFEEGFANGVGFPGRAFDASLKQEQIYTINPPSDSRRKDKLLTAHEIEGERLLVTRFRREYLKEGQAVQVRTSPGWWQALGKIASWVVVDAPALERSPAALAMASQMRGIFLVVEADRTTPEDIENARAELEAHGGEVLGVVMNRVGADARLLERYAG